MEIFKYLSISHIEKYESQKTGSMGDEKNDI